MLSVRGWRWCQYRRAIPSIPGMSWSSQGSQLVIAEPLSERMLECFDFLNGNSDGCFSNPTNDERKARFYLYSHSLTFPGLLGWYPFCANGNWNPASWVDVDLGEVLTFYLQLLSSTRENALKECDSGPDSMPEATTTSVDQVKERTGKWFLISSDDLDDREVRMKDERWRFSQWGWWRRFLIYVSSDTIPSDAIPLSGSWMIKTLSFRRKKEKSFG